MSAIIVSVKKPLQPSDSLGQLVIGVDEAGRGPLAGPVVAAACILGSDVPLGVTDSKKLSAKQRSRIEALLCDTCSFAIAEVMAEEIDRINIFAATMLAMTKAVGALVRELGVSPAQVLIDGDKTPENRHSDWVWPARAIIKGDASEPCISAASILAKEHRDRVMKSAALSYPCYGWENNKGYGTAEHLAALRAHGPCPLHRRSFAPVAKVDTVR